MQDKFEIAYDGYLNSFSTSLSPELKSIYKKYALGNRDRGEEIANSIVTILGSSIHGLSCIDIGSGYGGLLLGLAKKGASVLGIEYDKQLYELSLTNIQDEPYDIHIRYGDILDREVIPAGTKFDLITINDVFEHIFDIEFLFKKLDQISHENTIIYFEIPNHHSYHAIRKEHHKHIYGLTLIEPGSWAEIVGSFNIYHRSFYLYKLLFKSIGYKNIRFNQLNKESIGTFDRIIREHSLIFSELQNHDFKTSRLKSAALSNFKKLHDFFVDESDHKSEEELFIEYEAYVWSGIIKKKSLDTQSNNITIEL